MSESVLTSVDDGIHLQDGDVSFVEGHFVARAAATCWLVSFHFDIICKTIRGRFYHDVNSLCRELNLK